MLKKILIFGATGNVGLEIVEESLRKEFVVSIFVRQKIQDDRITQFEGDVKNYESVLHAIKGNDCVVISLGTRNLSEPCDVLTLGTENIIKAMKVCGIKVVSACLASFVFWDQEKVPAAMKTVSLAHLEQLEILKTSGLDYIAICPPEIKSDKVEGGYNIAENTRIPGNVSKYHLAEFLVKVLNDTACYKKIYGIGTPELNKSH